MLRLRIAAIAVAALLARSTVAQQPSVSIALLPFENVSGAAEATAGIRAAFVEQLGSKGWDVAPEQVVDAILEQQRVRYLDTVDQRARGALIETTVARGIVTGSIYSWREGRNAAVSVSARLIRPDGSVAWSDVAGLTADETEGAFGFGRIESAASLGAAAVRRLLATFPAPGAESRQIKGSGKPMFRSGATAFRSSELDPQVPHKIAILPFENTTSSADASWLIADLLSLRLAAVSGFEVVDPAALRKAAHDARLSTFRNVGAAELEKLAAILGTPLFLRGTVYEFLDGAAAQQVSPEVFVEFTLTDVDAGRVVWAAQHHRRGSEYSGLLLRGTVTDVVTLADRTLSEMIDAEGLATPRAAAAFAATRAARQKRQPATRTQLSPPTKGKNEP